MCGIVGALSKGDVLPVIVDGLKQLEYRGYDSAGVAFKVGDQLEVVKAVGKVKVLVERLRKRKEATNIGIGHTRWATHGKPDERNAHPQTAGGHLALVHNGVIENYLSLKNDLIAKGYRFVSDTDTEVIVQLIEDFLLQGNSLLAAVQQTVSLLRGNYAFAVLDIRNTEELIGVKAGNPLVVGLGDEGVFVASDPRALAKQVKQFIYLENNDIALLQRDQVKVYDFNLKQVERIAKTVSLGHIEAELGFFDHYMQKEIFEQPGILKVLAEDLRTKGVEELFGKVFAQIKDRIKFVHMVACGSSYHAALVGKYWLETHAGLPCQVEIASEYRYRQIVVNKGTLFVTISQSGETADTLAALHRAKGEGYLTTLAICNVGESSLVRESESCFLTKAGLEIGVATTKAFTAQLMGLWGLTLVLGRKIAEMERQELMQQIRLLAGWVDQVLALEPAIMKLAKLFKRRQGVFYLGRGLCYPIALEGALKLKELSYLHAEGYPAGELKHGPLALIEKNVPVVVMMPVDGLHEKILSNLQEVSSRGGKIILFADSRLDYFLHENWYICKMPEVPKDFAPIVYAVVLQLFAYHVALLRETDIDQPRNLAKSVTVE